MLGWAIAGDAIDRRIEGELRNCHRLVEEGGTEFARWLADGNVGFGEIESWIRGDRFTRGVVKCFEASKLSKLSGEKRSKTH